MGNEEVKGLKLTVNRITKALFRYTHHHPHLSLNSHSSDNPVLYICPERIGYCQERSDRGKFCKTP